MTIETLYPQITEAIRRETLEDLRAPGTRSAYLGALWLVSVR